MNSPSPCHQEPSPSIPACHQVPLPEEIQVSPGDTEIHRVEPEDVANHLTAFHWELFRCVHEVGTEASAGQGQEGEMSQWESVFVADPPGLMAQLQHALGQCTAITFSRLCPPI